MPPCQVTHPARVPLTEKPDDRPRHLVRPNGAVEVALAVPQELASSKEEPDRLRHDHVERARYKTDPR
jgi:hypothetical protein